MLKKIKPKYPLF